MSKRTAVPQAVLALTCAALLASVFPAAPARAEDPAPAPAAAPAKPAAADSASAGKAKKAKTPKAPRVRAPEKSLEEQRAADGPWMKRSNWLSIRAGYAKAVGQYSGDAFGGYGIAYQRFLSPQWGFGGSVHHELLGRLGPASEIAVPFTLELTRHFKWHTAMRPYVGFGGGYYFHKFYRTGGDNASPGTGFYVSFGGNLPVDPRYLLGLDVRASFVSQDENVVNPVFGKLKPSETEWSVKLNWAFAY